MKGLAVVVGFYGVAWAFFGPAVLIAVATGLWPTHRKPGDQAAWIWLCGLTAIMGILGYLILRQVWGFFRRPDRVTARSVARWAALLLGVGFFGLVNKTKPLPRLDLPWGPVLELSFAVGMILTCVLFYRLVLRRLTEHAFPPPANTQQSGS